MHGGLVPVSTGSSGRASRGGREVVGAGGGRPGCGTSMGRAGRDGVVASVRMV